MAKLVLILLSSLAILSAIKTGSAVEYSVTNTAANTPGGARFETDIGAQYSLETMDTATNFIWELFQQSDPEDRKNVDRISMFVDDMDGVAYASNSEIHVSAGYIQGYSGDVKTEITGILYHEMAHNWQWDGKGQTPEGLVEGIADFVRLKAGYEASYWVAPGQGDRWDQGYDVTARFLDYCNDLGDGTFVAELNNMMRDGYNVGFFEELLGDNVDTLWSDYKAIFGN